MRRVFAILTATAIVFAMLQTVASGASASFPTVSGGFGQTPKITFPPGAPPKTLESKVLEQGHGPVVKKADLLVANYVGEIWGGKVFDSSFARAEPAGFAIGIGEVIPGWDKVLVGQKVGSRVLMVLPPADGYGPSGLSQAGIKGSDTLVFVVDLIATYNKSVSGDPHAAKLTSGVPGITVGGTLGKPPTIKIAKSAKQPTKVTMTVLDRGNGTKLTRGLVVLQLEVFDWSGQDEHSSWSLGTPEGDVIGDSTQASVLDTLVGVHIGSRVLLQLPKSSQAGGPFAVVIDVVAEQHGTKAQATA